MFEVKRCIIIYYLMKDYRMFDSKGHYYIFNTYLKFFLANKKRLWIQGRDSLQENIMQHEQPGGARDDLTNKIKA